MKRKAPKEFLAAAKKAGFGTPGNPGGRRPIAIELKAREFIMGCINGEVGMDKLIRKIYFQAMKGQFKQQELLLNYIIGKPTDRIRIESAYGAPLQNYNPVIKIIADHLRLEKLNKDAGDGTQTPERIQEMEDVLNDAIKNAPPSRIVEDNKIVGKNGKKK